MKLKNILLLEPYNTPINILTKEQSNLSTDKKKALIVYAARLVYIKYKLRLTSVHSIPLGLAQLSSVAKQEGLSTYHIPFILDSLKRYLSDNEIEKKIGSYNYNTVWLSVGSPESAFETLRYAKIIKKINSNTPIMIGGVLPSTYPEFFLSHEEIDYLIRGSAEFAVRQYLRNNNEGNFKNIQGFCYRSHSGKSNISPKFAIEPDLNKIPPFDLEGLNIDEYMKDNYFCNLQTSRGCPYDCPFCIHANFWGPKVKYRPISHLRKELRILQEHGCKAGYIIDSIFTLNKEHVRRFVEAYNEENISIKLAFETRADMYSEEMAKLTKNLTPFYVWFGGESGSPKVLRRLRGKEYENGHGHIKNMFKAVKNAKKYNLLCGSSWVIGLPNESKDTLQETKKVIFELTEAGMDVADIRILQIFPGTPYFNEPEKWGLRLIQKGISEQSTPWDTYAGHATEALSPEEIVAGAEEIRDELYNYYLSRARGIK